MTQSPARSPASPLPSPTERRRLRQSRSLSQAEVAARVGVTPKTVQSWETGRTTPQGRRREAYARLLQELAGSAPVAAEAESKPEPVPVEPVPEPEPEARPAAEPEPVAEAEPPALTPAQAFDALYEFCAPSLVQQTYLLTGRRQLARESVDRAFQLAWQRWPEVAVDPYPEGWVRAVAYEYALSPWHRLRLRHRRPDTPPVTPSDRRLLSVLLSLPPPYRRTLLLHDGLGVGLPETAAETEASTVATANRLLHAREAIAERFPDLTDPQELRRRLARLSKLADKERQGRRTAPKPATVRTSSERQAQYWTRAAIACTTLLVAATVITVKTAPSHYEPPVPPGEKIHGVPPRAVPGPLSNKQQKLRAKLRSESTNGPERLLPEGR
ncbi:helix-turn-helix domain-containing protein [Streptomyces sp. NBC_00286]|uniref:helix-turn-helix domain-containing protein n=1 Tax=Streptomyces sp. NBC_00286 TaxID=2975701 RepID=UPI002E2BF9B3|nr:helix-turn-helix domain-containing protein [Streptomyces sp. NBC_00286]